MKSAFIPLLILIVVVLASVGFYQLLDRRGGDWLEQAQAKASEVVDSQLEEARSELEQIAADPEAFLEEHKDDPRVQEYLADKEEKAERVSEFEALPPGIKWDFRQSQLTLLASTPALVWTNPESGEQLEFPQDELFECPEPTFVREHWSGSPGWKIASVREQSGRGKYKVRNTAPEDLALEERNSLELQLESVHELGVMFPRPEPPLDSFAELSVEWTLEGREEVFRSAPVTSRNYDSPLRFAGLPEDAERHRFIAEQPDSWPACSPWLTFETQPLFEPLTLRPMGDERRTLVFEVLDAAGEPVEGARVCVVPDHQKLGHVTAAGQRFALSGVPLDGGPSAPNLLGRTDARGRTTLNVEPLGSYRVAVYSDVHASFLAGPFEDSEPQQTLAFGSGVELGLDLRATRESLDSRGLARLASAKFIGEGCSLWIPRSAVADESLVHTFAAVAPGEYELQVFARPEQDAYGLTPPQRRVWTQTVFVESGRTAEVRWQLPLTE